MNRQAVTAWISVSGVPMRKPTVLVVDDDRTMCAVLKEVLEKGGYRLLLAQNSAEASRHLNERYEGIDVILLDHELPDMNGMELAAKVKKTAHLAGIPIIMLTGTEDKDNFRRGVETGVFQYLTKPVDNSLLKTAVASALNESNQKRALTSQLTHHTAAMRNMVTCSLSIKTINDAEAAASLIASCFPRPEAAVMGLMELMVNAIEHGNLGITHEEKSKLLAEGIWRTEVDRRANLPENVERRTEILYHKREGNHLVRITDSGKGFDWKRHWHADPARAEASHGRGIVRARLMSFDRMEYNAAGNQVTVSVSTKQANHVV